jgi:ABC-type Zn uptake system ZnuABC Zn-binding protein ZnuA
MRHFTALLLLIALLTSCAPAAAPAGQGFRVLAVETFLADIAQNVAGDRLKVAALIPIGVDPHGFQPAPADVKKVADSQLLIVNGAGFEEFLDELLKNAGGERTIIEAAAGLKMREKSAAERSNDHEGDPHFWLDPVSVIKYAENIRDGLSQADPAGKETYARNADAYIAQLKELDQWIAGQVKQIPEANRKLVTNHESFGYFADRYGFTVIGTIIPGASTGAAPSARELAELVQHVKAAGVKAIFLETGTNAQLAQQLAQETGVKAVTELYTHSVTGAKGPAPTYLDMMRYNVKMIVDGLK